MKLFLPFLSVATSLAVAATDHNGERKLSNVLAGLSASLENPRAAIGEGNWASLLSCTVDLDGQNPSPLDEDTCATVKDSEGRPCVWCDAATTLGSGACMSPDQKVMLGEIWDRLCAAGGGADPLPALRHAEAADPDSRILRRQSDESQAGRLQRMIDAKCPTFECDAATTEGASCTFETLERPDTSGLTEDQISELKDEMRAKKKEQREKLLECACCGGMSAEDILEAKGKGGGSRPSAGEDSGRPTMGGGGGSGRPGMGSGSGSGRPGTGSSGGSRGPGMGNGSGSGRPDMGGDGGSGRPGSLEKMFDAKCPTFDCNTVTESVDCSRFDSMNTNTRGGRRNKILYCGCCRD